MQPIRDESARGHVVTDFDRVAIRRRSSKRRPQQHVPVRHDPPSRGLAGRSQADKTDTKRQLRNTVNRADRFPDYAAFFGTCRADPGTGVASDYGRGIYRLAVGRRQTNPPPSRRRGRSTTTDGPLGHGPGMFVSFTLTIAVMFYLDRHCRNRSHSAQASGDASKATRASRAGERPADLSGRDRARRRGSPVVTLAMQRDLHADHYGGV